MSIAHIHDMMNSPKIARVAALTAPVLLLASCSSPKPRYGEFRERLGAATVTLEHGAPRDAHRDVIALARELQAADGADYGVQRYLAEALLVRIHASAADTGAFLTEPDRFDFSLNAGSGDGRRPSSTAHQIAAIYHAWNIIGDAPPLLPDGVAADDLAPPNLVAFATGESARSFGWLVVASSLAELGFGDKATRIVEQVEHPRFGRVFAKENARADADLKAAMDDLKIPAGRQAKLAQLAFELHKERFENGGRAGNPTQAYRLGCLAAFGPLREREGTKFMEHAGATDAEFRDQFFGWVQSLSESSGVFRSSSQTELRRGIQSCDLSGEPAIDFVWTRKGSS